MKNPSAKSLLPFRGEPEHHLQAQSVAWFAWQHPRHAGLLFAIPNGGQRNKATAGRLKAEGVLPGVADLFLSLSRQGKHGLYIEMKTAKGAQRTSQREFQQRVTDVGYAYVIARSLEDFQAHIEAYLAPAALPSIPGHRAGIQLA